MLHLSVPLQFQVCPTFKSFQAACSKLQARTQPPSPRHAMQEDARGRISLLWRNTPHEKVGRGSNA